MKSDTSLTCMYLIHKGLYNKIIQYIEDPNNEPHTKLSPAEIALFKKPSTKTKTKYTKMDNTTSSPILSGASTFPTRSSAEISDTSTDTLFGTPPSTSKSTLDSTWAANVLKCRICDKTFNNASDFRIHSEKCEEKNAPKLFKCHKCNKTYLSKSSLNRHVNQCEPGSAEKIPKVAIRKTSRTRNEIKRYPDSEKKKTPPPPPPPHKAGVSLYDN